MSLSYTFLFPRLFLAWQHRHSGGRNTRRVGRAEAGRIVGKQTTRQQGRECRGWDGLERLKPDIGNQGIYRSYIYTGLLCLTAVCDHILRISIE